MNPALARVERKTCFSCSYQGETAEKTCPRCGHVLRSSKNLRIRGGILIACGGFLIVFMGAIAAFVGYLYFGGTMHIPQAQAGKTGVMMLLIFGVFGLVMLFGLLSLINGIYMFKTGRRSLILMWLMIGMVFILVIGCTLISVVLR